MKKNYHKPYFFLVLVFVMVGLSACDPETETVFVIENTLNEDIIIHFIEKNSLPDKPDSLLVSARSNREYVKSSNNESRSAYVAIEEFIQVHDSIFVIRQDGMYSRNFMNENDWKFRVLEDKFAYSKGQYTLQIQVSDF